MKIPKPTYLENEIIDLENNLKAIQIRFKKILNIESVNTAIQRGKLIGRHKRYTGELSYLLDLYLKDPIEKRKVLESYKLAQANEKD